MIERVTEAMSEAQDEERRDKTRGVQEDLPTELGIRGTSWSGRAESRPDQLITPDRDPLLAGPNAL